MSTPPYSNYFPHPGNNAAARFGLDPIYQPNDYNLMARFNFLREMYLPRTRKYDIRGLGLDLDTKGYSKDAKAFSGPIPYDHETNKSCSFVERFDVDRLAKTDVLDPATAPISKVIGPLISKMGNIQTDIGEAVGTCTLISDDLVMVPRHAITGEVIRNLKVTFGYTEQINGYFDSGETEFETVVEEDAFCDYAIVKLKHPVGRRFGHVKLNILDDFVTEPALLHYPLGKPLKVSINAVFQTNYRAQYLETYHDSDYFSSGGAYFDPLGRFTAMHLGSQLEEDVINPARYAITLQEIVLRKPDGIIAKLARGELAQDELYNSTFKGTIFLETSLRDLLINEEGRESKKVLTCLFQDQLDYGHDSYDSKIKLDKSGEVAFSKKNLIYIESEYPYLFDTFLKECLFRSNVHKDTPEFSEIGHIESDHTIPHAVWKSTTNPKMSRHIVVNSKRIEEFALPDSTIPFEIPTEFLTTRSSSEAKTFHAKLVQLCDQDQIDKALVECFKKYRAKGITLKLHKEAIIQSLDEHIELGVITTQQKTQIIAALNL